MPEISDEDDSVNNRIDESLVQVNNIEDLVKDFPDPF